MREGLDYSYFNGCSCWKGREAESWELQLTVAKVQRYDSPSLDKTPPPQGFLIYKQMIPQHIQATE